mmetsp:Transcript_95179/g.254459  ORF Transcript_95179/g.254459 Transcript_95179/m.254459 type:complete len:200 (-) Transcript_95179:3254-3853(-)
MRGQQHVRFPAGDHAGRGGRDAPGVVAAGERAEPRAGGDHGLDGGAGFLRGDPPRHGSSSLPAHHHRGECGHRRHHQPLHLRSGQQAGHVPPPRRRRRRAAGEHHPHRGRGGLGVGHAPERRHDLHHPDVPLRGADGYRGERAGAPGHHGDVRVHHGHGGFDREPRGAVHAAGPPGGDPGPLPAHRDSVQRARAVPGWR